MHHTKGVLKEAFNKNSNIPDVLALVEHKEYAIKTPSYSFYQSIEGLKTEEVSTFKSGHHMVKTYV